MIKIVDGVEVVLTPEEEVEYMALQASYDPLVEWRETAHLTKGQFCIAIAKAGIVTWDEARTAANGGWPQAFASALDDMTEEQMMEAQIVWATAQHVERNHPLLLSLQALSGKSDAEIDEMFGWQPPTEDTTPEPEEDVL